MAAKQKTRKALAGKNANGKHSKLLAEREQLAEEVKRLRKEKRQLLQSLGALLFGPVTINKRAMLAEAATQPLLDDLIADIEKTEV